MTDPYELAVLEQRIASDRWDRFRNFAPNCRDTIDESERMRVDFIRQVQVMLTSDGDVDRNDAAAWVAKNAGEVAYRAAIVRAMFRRFVEVDMPPMAVVLK